MTVVNRETGELIEVTVAEVWHSIEVTITHLEQAAEQIVWQVQHKVWLVLGHESWDELRRVVYKGAAIMVPRADRPELVARLDAEGLSTQVIGDTLGVTARTVRKDVGKSSHVAVPATRTDSLGRKQPTTRRKRTPEPEPVDLAPVEKPAPKPARQQHRRKLHEGARTAGWELHKAVERIEKIAADDRFDHNKDVMASLLRSHLQNAVTVCQDLLDRIDQ